MEKMLTVLHDAVWPYLPSTTGIGAAARTRAFMLVTPKTFEIDRLRPLNRSRYAYTPQDCPVSPPD